MNRIISSLATVVSLVISGSAFADSLTNLHTGQIDGSDCNAPAEILSSGARSKMILAGRIATMGERHPYSVYTCLSSKASRSKAVQAGGETLEPFSGTDHGHLFVYLHGVCVDRSGPYEKLVLCKTLPTCDHQTTPQKPCAPAVPSWHEEYGTMVGVENWHRNRAFLAVQGWDLAINGVFGNRAPDPIGMTMKRVLDEGVVHGVHGVKSVEVRDARGKASWTERDMTEREMAAATLSTITAISRYRNISCHQLYLNDESEMAKVIEAYNAENKPFEEGQFQFRYNGYNQNCVLNTRIAKKALAEERMPAALLDANGIQTAKSEMCKLENYGDLFDRVLIGKQVAEAKAAGIHCADISTNVAEPARDFKHEAIVSARPIPDPMQAFSDENYVAALMGSKTPRFPPQVEFDVHYGQSNAASFGADISPDTPLPTDNFFLKDREKLPYESVNLDPLSAVKAKLAQYESRLAYLGGKPSSGECRAKLTVSDFSGASYVNSWGNRDIFRDSLGLFPEFYARYVQALCSGIAQLRADIRAMKSVPEPHLPCRALSDMFFKPLEPRSPTLENSFLPKGFPAAPGK